MGPTLIHLLTGFSYLEEREKVETKVPRVLDGQARSKAKVGP